MASNGKLSAPRAPSSSLFDWFKPLRGEAIARLRTNSVGLVGLTILCNMLPIPSPWRALEVVWQRRPAGSPYYYLCAVELLLFAVLALNIVQATYALKYPRIPPPPPSPAKPPTKASPLSPPVRQWHLQSTPALSPQRQKAFTTYAPSPISTPSRTLNYAIPPTASSPPDASLVSSVCSVPGSPASPLAAYRGRHSASVGRAFDGSLLGRLVGEDSDED